MSNLTFKKCFEYYKPNQEIATAIFSSTEDKTKHVIIAEPLAEVWYEPRAISYLAGPIVDRLAAFEDIGFEPEELAKIVTEYKKMKDQEQKLAKEPVKEPKRLDALAAMAYSHNVLQNMYPKKMTVATAGVNKNGSRLIFNDIKDTDSLYPKSLFISTDGWNNDSIWDMKCKKFAKEAQMPIGLRALPEIDEMHDVPISETLKNYIRMDVESTGKMLLSAIYGAKMRVMPEIKDVIFSDPATIIFWKDGTKTVVKAQDGEKYDPEKGLAMAISKKALGNTREYYHTFLRWRKKGKKGPERKVLDIRVPASDLAEAFRKFGEEIVASVGITPDGEEVVTVEKKKEKKNGRKD